MERNPLKKMTDFLLDLKNEVAFKNLTEENFEIFSVHVKHIKHLIAGMNSISLEDLDFDGMKLARDT